MKRILATTALALTLAVPSFAVPVLADGHSKAANYVEMQQKSEILASDFIGMRIYATEKNVDAETGIEKGMEKEWDDIGEVNNVVLGRDGSVKAVVLGIGGFLGIGEKDVAVEMSSIKFVREKADENDFFLVVNTSKKMLETAPAYKRADG